MNLTYPPLPITHKHEKKLFNDFYREHPTANDTNRKKLVKLFLEKSNCTTIFPKLLSIIEAYENKWKKVV